MFLLEEKNQIRCVFFYSVLTPQVSSRMNKMYALLVEKLSPNVFNELVSWKSTLSW